MCCPVQSGELGNHVRHVLCITIGVEAWCDVLFSVSGLQDEQVR